MAKLSNSAQAIVDSVMEAIRNGTASWMKSWKATKTVAHCNYCTSHEYSGVNAIMTNLVASAKGYQDRRWLTFKQAKEQGLSVRKGEKGTPILFFSFVEKEVTKEDGSKEIDRFPAHKVYYLFNVEQVDGTVKPDNRLDGYQSDEDLAIPAWKQAEVAEQVLSSSQAKIIHKNQDKAFYSPTTDSIYLPLKGQFASASGYYNTALHELAHWTGHESRLNRFKSGTEEYAKEELRAEIASWMLAESLGVDFEPQNSQAYVASWLKVLEDTPRELFKAASDAEKIKAYLINLSVAENKKAA